MSIKPGDQIRASDFRGMIMMWPNVTPPAEWLLCNGQAVSRTTYADLFALVGTVFGAGDGSTTFNVPDMRGSVPIGAGQKTRSVVETIAPADINLALNAFLVEDARKYGNAKAVTVSAGAGQVFGIPTGFSGTTSITSAGWITRGNNPLPKIGTKIVISVEGNVSGVSGIKYVHSHSGDSFRVSNTLGGSAITSATADSWSGGWARIPDSFTEGESAQTTWQDSGDYFTLGGNSMPEVGDRILVTYASSVSLSLGGIYTVNFIDTPNSRFSTNGGGSDSGTIRWINLGPEVTQPQEVGTYYGVYIDDTHIALATSFANAIAGVYLDINSKGTANITLTYNDTLTDRSLGDEGGHEINNINLAEIPAHTHSVTTENNTGGSQLYIGENSDATGASPSTQQTGNQGGSVPQSVMQPFTTVNFIIKT